MPTYWGYNENTYDEPLSRDPLKPDEPDPLPPFGLRLLMASIFLGSILGIALIAKLISS